MLPQFRRSAKARELFALAGESGGMAGLSQSLLINGQTVDPALYYLGQDGLTNSWPAVVGPTLTTAQTLQQRDAPTAGAADRGFGRDVFLASRLGTSTNIAVGTDDFVCEVVGQVSDTGNAYAIGWNPGGTVDLSVRVNPGGNASLTINDGTTGITVNTAGYTFVARSWFHLLVFADRNASAALYVNGTLRGAAVISTAPDSLTPTNGFDVGHRLTAGDWRALFGLIGLWHQANWLDTHLQGDLARDRYAQIVGIYAPTATLDLTASRPSEAYMDKVSHEDGIRRLHLVSREWHRFTRAPDELWRINSGYVAEIVADNVCLQSQDFATTWAVLDVGDVVTANDSESPTGEPTADLITGSATDGLHGVSQSITLTAAEYTFSVFVKPTAGGVNWLYMDVSTIANVSAYFDLGNTNLGAVGSAASARIAYWGDNWYRCELTYTGTAAAHTHRIAAAEADGDNSVVSPTLTLWQADVVAAPAATSPILTTTVSKRREGDDIAYDLSGAFTEGSLALTVLVPDIDETTNGRLASINDGTTDNRLTALIDASTDAFRWTVFDTAVAQCNVIGTTDMADNLWREVRGTWGPDDFQVYVDGQSEGTPDTSGTVPAGLDTLFLGVELSANQPRRAVIYPRILSRRSSANVADVGDLVGAHIAARISTEAGTSATTAYTDLAGTWTEDNSEDFSINTSTGVITYSGTQTQWFVVTAAIHGGKSGGGANTITTAVERNGTAIEGGHARNRDVSGTGVGAWNLEVPIQLANGDTVNLAVKVATGAETVTCGVSMSVQILGAE